MLRLPILALMGLAAGASSVLAQSTVRADFNRDGFSDLAVGVSGEDMGRHQTAGAVNVLYGSAGGLSAAGDQFWSQDSPDIKEAAENGDFFGSSVAAGDFNGDGFADLAVGAFRDNAATTREAGGVNVLYGSAEGLSAAGNQFWSQDSPGILDVAEAGDFWGFALAADDFNGDGVSDLAVGAREENIGTISHAGAVNVLYGSSGGLSASGNQFWSQDSPGVAGDPDADDYFGGSLAGGDFNGDGFADLAIGVNGEDIVSMDAGAGAVNVLYGSAGGLSAAGNQFWHQDRGGINDVAEIGDIFGYSLAAGDFNRDGISDLAIGAFGESVKSSDNGAVNVLYGSATGLSAAGNQFWSQDSPGINDSAESGDDFGFALYAADFNGDDVADLAIGVFGEGVGSTLHSGAVQVLYGAVGGLAAAGNQFWSQDSPGIVDAAETEERLGYSLGGGDFDGDGFADLAIGVVFEDVGSADEAGAVNVLYGSAAGLSPAGNQLWHQDRGGIADQAEFQDDFGSALTP